MNKIYVILLEEKFQDGDVHTQLVKGFSNLDDAKQELKSIYKEQWEYYASQRDEDALTNIFEKRPDGMSFIENFLDNDYTEYRIEELEVK